MRTVKKDKEVTRDDEYFEKMLESYTMPPPPPGKKKRQRKSVKVREERIGNR
jgi:hypothetical protein